MAELLEKELRKPGYVARPLALGSNTDPYQPIERTLKLTRAVLEVLDRFNHPVTIVTKSAGVLRDLDILLRAGQPQPGARLAVGDDAGPGSGAAHGAAGGNACAAAAGHRATDQGRRAGGRARGADDPGAERRRAGAHPGSDVPAPAPAGGGYVLLRLPHELKAIFEDWLQQHFPDRARHVLELVRQTRAGALSDSRFGQRFTGTGAYADLLARRFARAARQWGLDGRDSLDCSQFAPPPQAKGLAESQMSLF